MAQATTTAPRSGLPGAPVGVLARAGRRLVRRPIDWYQREWTDDRVVQTAVTAAVLVVTTFITMRIVHFNPFSLFGIGENDLIFETNTPTGGDMGAHVWAPAYLRDHLLPNWQISGWSMDWYAGLPVYRFYMVVPGLAIVLFDTVLPYGVAFKVVAALGIVSLPLCSWAFGRLARFRYPMPELFALAALCFLLNESYDIFGGNVLSTMAGEFSFSIAISLMILGLGCLCRALDEGRFAVWAAVLLSLACLSHGIVLIYTVVTALVIVVCRCGADLWKVFTKIVADPDERQKQSLIYAVLLAPAAIALSVLIAQAIPEFYVVSVLLVLATLGLVILLAAQIGTTMPENNLFRKRALFACLIGGLTLLLSAFWVFPFVTNHEFMTDMKYAPYPESAPTAAESYWSMFFDQKPFVNFVIYGLALFGMVAVMIRRHVYGIALGLSGLIAAALVYLTHDSLPVIGLLWNPRVLPWVYLIRYLMMMVGAAELIQLVINLYRNRNAGDAPTIGERSFVCAAISLVVLLAFGWVYQVLPGGSQRFDETARANYYSWGPFNGEPGSRQPEDDKLVGNTVRAKADGWARYNFTGYEGRDTYPEYRDVVQKMGEVGQVNGCGRAMWERLTDTDDRQYGTPMALMLLPHWTDGCIQSSEGLFFEASGTTPYHFVTVDAMSSRASSPVRQVREKTNDAVVGVPLMQTLGIRYLMVASAESKEQADAHPDLVKVAESTPWNIYVVKDSPVVQALTTEPVVVNGRQGDQRECFLEVGMSWFQNRPDWAAMPAADGPENWQRIDVAIDPALQVPQGQPTNECGDPESSHNRQVNVVRPSSPIEGRELPAITVSNVDMREQSLSFDVSEPGVPVLVKVSYFPNWKVKGASGPYRVAPNFMVVVPTDTHVEMSYDSTTGRDTFFYGLTIVGLALAVYVRLRRPLRYARLASSMPRVAAALGGPSPSLAALAAGGPVLVDDDRSRYGPPPEPAPSGPAPPEWAQVPMGSLRAQTWLDRLSDDPPDSVATFDAARDAGEPPTEHGERR